MKPPPATKITVIHSEDEIPQFATEKEEAWFWDTHSLGDEFYAVPEPEPDWLRPVRARTTPLAGRFDPEVIGRLKALAVKKHKGYQTLLKEFVVERLYEEEKREGIIPAWRSPSPAPRTTPQKAPATPRTR